MKRWIFMLGLILLITDSSGATALVQTTDYLSFPVCALDSATGVEAVPESIHVHVWRGSLTNATVYSNREAVAGADAAQIDSVDYGGLTVAANPPQYYFHDQVQDIDGDGTAGVYTINVRLWRGTTATSNWFSFQVVDSSFNNALTRVGQINEDTKNLTFTGTDVKATLDGETVSLNSAQAGSLNTLMADVDGIKAKSDSSSYGPSGHIKSTPQTDVTLSGGTISGIATANWAAGTRTLTVADWSTHSAADAAHSAYDTLYVHKEDFHSDGDTNTNPFDAGTDSVLQTKSIPVYVQGTPDVNMAQISGDATAADNVEDVFNCADTTAPVATMAVNQFWVKTTKGGNSHGIAAYGINGGSGFFSQGGATGHGIEFKGGATSGHGLYGYGTTSGNGMYLLGAGTVKSGFAAQGSATGPGLSLQGGASGGAGFAIQANATNVDGLWIQSGGGTGSDIKLNYPGRIEGYIDSATAVGVGGDGLKAGSIEADAIGASELAETAVEEVTHNILGHADTAWAAETPGDKLKDIDTDLATVDGNVDDIKTKTDKLLFSDDDTLVIDNEVAWDLAGGASTDTSKIKTLMQNNWDSDTDGELSVELPAGTGSDTLDIIVFDADTTAVEGVDLCVYNPTKTAKAVPSITTDVNGYCQVFLDPGSYPTFCRRLGVILAEWDTVTVPSGGGRDTIWVVAQDAGSPPSGDLTQVKGYIRTMTDNQYSRGWIEFAFHDANVMDTASDPSVYVDPTPNTTQVDTGAFTVNLKPSESLLSVVQDGPDKDSVTYDVIIWSPGQTTFRWFNVFIPDSSGAVWLEDLID